MTKRADPPTRVHCVREVRVGMPLERRLEIEDFYRFVLGLEPWALGRQIPGGWGAGDCRCGVYFQFRHDPPVDPLRRRFVLAVESLDALEQRLRERELAYSRRRGLGFSDQVICVQDPAGHWIEIRQNRLV